MIACPDLSGGSNPRPLPMKSECSEPASLIASGIKTKNSNANVGVSFVGDEGFEPPTPSV